jgi:hypothetical protein
MNYPSLYLFRIPKFKYQSCLPNLTGVSWPRSLLPCKWKVSTTDSTLAPPFHTLPFECADEDSKWAKSWMAEVRFLGR